MHWNKQSWLVATIFATSSHFIMPKNCRMLRLFTKKKYIAALLMSRRIFVTNMSTISGIWLLKVAECCKAVASRSRPFRLTYLLVVDVVKNICHKFVDNRRYRYRYLDTESRVEPFMARSR